MSVLMQNTANLLKAKEEWSQTVGPTGNLRKSCKRPQTKKLEMKATEKYEKLELTRPRIKIKRHESQPEADRQVENDNFEKQAYKNDEEDVVSKSTMNMMPTRASL